MANSIKDPISVSIIGGSGYTGAELIRLVSKHPHFQLYQVVANRNAGKKIQDLFPHLRHLNIPCLLYTSPSPRDKRQSRMPSSA